MPTNEKGRPERSGRPFSLLRMMRCRSAPRLLSGAGDAGADDGRERNKGEDDGKNLLHGDAIRGLLNVGVEMRDAA